MIVAVMAVAVAVALSPPECQMFLAYGVWGDSTSIRERDLKVQGQTRGETCTSIRERDLKVQGQTRG